MTKLQLNIDECGRCTSTTCKFQSDCAQHKSAGEFREEDGFRPIIGPIISQDNIPNELVCVTGGTDAHESFSSLPCNCDVLLFGRYSLEELNEMKQSTQQAVTTTKSIETDFSAKAMREIVIKVREQCCTLESIFSKIQQAARNGETDLLVSLNNKDVDIEKSLDELGYLTYFTNDAKGWYIHISW